MRLLWLLCLAGCSLEPGEPRRAALVSADCPPCQVADETGTACVPAPFATDPKGDCLRNVSGCTADSCDGRGSCRVADNTSCGHYYSLPDAGPGYYGFPYCSAGVCEVEIVYSAWSIEEGGFCIDASWCRARNPCVLRSCFPGNRCSVWGPVLPDGTACGDGAVCRAAECAHPDGATCSHNRNCISGNCVAYVCTPLDGGTVPPPDAGPPPDLTIFMRDLLAQPDLAPARDLTSVPPDLAPKDLTAPTDPRAPEPAVLDAAAPGDLAAPPDMGASLDLAAPPEGRPVLDVDPGVTAPLHVGASPARGCSFSPGAR